MENRKWNITNMQVNNTPRKNKALNKRHSNMEPNKPKYKTVYTNTPQYNKPM